MRVATWNVNSIRTRLDRVTDWLARADIDVLAMQETKCSDSQFPTLPFFELGYEVAHVGFNQWNGVAIASRVGLDDVQIGFDGQPTWSSKPDVAATAEARALGAPAGACGCGVFTCPTAAPWTIRTTSTSWIGLPHCVIRPQVGYATIRRRRSRWSATGTSPPPTRSLEPRILAGSTHVSEPERKAFNAIGEAQFTDVVRPFTPGPDVYTYWGYTQLRFPKRQGMRIDFILGSPALAARVTDAQIVREERKGKAPSDHAPVLVDVRGE